MSNYLKQHESERLILRPLVENDAEKWIEFIMNERCTQFFPESMKLKPEYAESWIANILNRYKNQGYGLLALEEKETGIFVGQCGLLVQDVNGVNEIEIGYHLLPKHWGKGYASEAAIWNKNYAFEVDRLKTIVSLIDPQNFSSQAVATKNGMQPDGHSLHKGSPVIVYRVNNEFKHQLD